MAATITPAVGRADRIIHTAAREGNVERIREQIALGERFQAIDSQGRVPLHIAVIHSQVEAARLLLELGGAWIPLTEDEFASPLHLAASTGNLEIMGLILNHYPPEQIIDLKDLFGMTALNLARKKGSNDGYELILEKSAESIQSGLRTLHLIFEGSISGRFDDLKPSKELLNPPIFSSAAEISIQGVELQNSLIEAYKKGELSEQISSLTALAALCLERRDEWRAALLLNSAYAVAKNESISSECRKRVIELIEQAEATFIRNKLNSTLPYQSRIQHYRLRLHRIREQCSITLASVTSLGGDLLSGLRMANPNAPYDPQANMLFTEIGAFATIATLRDQTIHHALHDLNREYKELLTDLLNESIEIMGRAPPTPFAMVGLGSLSRQEACPYSDIEFIFILEDGSEEARKYFRLLTQLIQLKIINLGETEVKIIKIDRKNHSLTSSGFSMDIGGLSPLGKEGLYELIGAPQELAQFQTEEWVSEHDAEIILVNAMRTACLISGKATLFKAYQKEVNRILNDRGDLLDWLSLKPRLRQKRALELMRGCLDEFKPRLDQEKIKLRAYDVKKEFYRPLQNIISSLALYYGINKNNTFDQLIDLIKMKVISKGNGNKLGGILILIFNLRFQTHLFYRSETEILYYFRKRGDVTGKHLFFVSPKVRLQIEAIYSVLIPLHRAGTEFISGDEKAFSSIPLWDSSISTVGDKRSPNLSPSSVPSSSSSVSSSSYDPVHPAALNPNSLSSLLHLGTTQFEQSDFEKAIQTYQ